MEVFDLNIIFGVFYLIGVFDMVQSKVQIGVGGQSFLDDFFELYGDVEDLFVWKLDFFRSFFLMLLGMIFRGSCLVDMRYKVYFKDQILVYLGL